MSRNQPAMFPFSVRLFTKYQTPAENGNTVSFHHTLMLGLVDGSTLCKNPLILYAFASNCLNSQGLNRLLLGKQTIQNSDGQSFSSINSKNHNGEIENVFPS